MSVRAGSKAGRVVRRAGLLVVGAVAPLAWLSTSPAAGSVDDTATSTYTLTDTAEGWYADAPVNVCTSPIGCPPTEQPPVSPYPADTLHVGVAGGVETSRAYVVPNVSTLPFGSTVTAATMTLPVGTGSTDGTLMAASAHVLACLATAPVTDGTAGSIGPPPATDCSVASGLEYDATRNAFTVDLTAFVQKWLSGSPPDGVALIASGTTQQTDAWQVTFNGRNRAGAPHISTSVTVQPPAEPVIAPVPVPPPPPAPIAAPPVVPPATVVAPAAPPVVAPQQPVAPATAPVAYTRTFQYPLVFLLPLALLAGVVFLARLFTRDATPTRVRA
jgi:hypothetical protein